MKYEEEMLHELNCIGFFLNIQPYKLIVHTTNSFLNSSSCSYIAHLNNNGHKFYQSCIMKNINNI